MTMLCSLTLARGARAAPVAASGVRSSPRGPLSSVAGAAARATAAARALQQHRTRSAAVAASRRRQCCAVRASATAGDERGSAFRGAAPPHEVLRVEEPTVLQIAFSTELVVATASVPIAFFSYGPLCNLLRLGLQSGAPSDDLVNFFVTVTGLLFGFIVSSTFSVLYSQQEELFEAIYKEAAAVNRLLEEAECALKPAEAAVVARETRRFLTDGAWAHQADTPPAEVLAAEINSDDDALENVMRLLLRAKPAGDLDMHDTLRGLREACVARLAAAQRKIPRVQFFIVKQLGAMTLMVFPLLGLTSSDGGLLSTVEAGLFASMVGVVALFSCIVDDLADLDNGLYSVTPVRATLQAALLAKADTILTASVGDGEKLAGSA